MKFKVREESEEKPSVVDTIKIGRFKGNSPEFKNLTEGSIHKVVECPDEYKDRELQKGYWVMGVTEPVLVLMDELDYSYFR